MATILISYNRDSEDTTRILADDIEALGHTVWFDQELSGGQVWWNQILAKIRDSDVFVFVLTPGSLKSTACRREYAYAADLGKPVLPVLVSEGVSINLLPPALSKIQFVDYRNRDRAAALRLARALDSVPRPEPLPDPLPEPPEAPISYLGNLTERIQTTSTLSYEEQGVLLVDLRRSLRASETSDDALTLLKELRIRRDLYATIAEEVDELLDEHSQEAKSADETESEAETSGLISASDEDIKLYDKKLRQLEKASPAAKEVAVPASTDRKPTKQERVRWARRGALVGTAAGVIAILPYSFKTGDSGTLVFGLIPGVGGAIVAAVSGTQRKDYGAALIGAASGWFWLFSQFVEDSVQDGIAAGTVWGASAGAILGVLAGRKLRELWGRVGRSRDSSNPPRNPPI